jgi:hypothetical protein
MTLPLRNLAPQLLAPLLLAGLLLLTVTGLLTRCTATLIAPVTRMNQAYLDASIKDTAHLMIPVGAAKAAADAVEGSTINIEAGAVFAKAGMTIEAGDTLQPVLDFINIAWKLLLLSMIYLVTAKSVLAGTGAVAAPLLTVALCAFLAERLAALGTARGQALRQALRRVGALFLLGALLFVLIIPLTVTGSAYLSRHTTEPMREEVRASFDKIGATFSLDNFHETTDLKDKAIVLKDKIVELGRYSKTAVSEVSIAVCKLAAIKLLNGIVFPLASFAFLVWLVRGCLCPALGLSDRPLAQEDLQSLRNWFEPPRARRAAPPQPGNGNPAPETAPDGAPEA